MLMMGVQSAKQKTEGLPRQTSVESKDEAEGSSVPVEVDDTAMFERKKPIPSLTDSVFQMRKASPHATACLTAPSLNGLVASSQAGASKHQRLSKKGRYGLAACTQRQHCNASLHCTLLQVGVAQRSDLIGGSLICVW